MRTRLILATIIVLVFGGSYLAKGWLGERHCQKIQPLDAPRRIISMAPSITETLFALGLGDRVVGVTRYCTSPSEASRKTCIGGHLDPNLEAVIALRPDLVILLEEQAQAKSALERLGIRTLVVCHKSVDGIAESISTLGKTLGQEDQAAALVGRIRARLAGVARKTAGRPRPRVLVVVDREAGCGGLRAVYVAGCDGHLDRIVELAGGQNACGEQTVRFPVVSIESITQMNPQVILDIVSEETSRRLGQETILADWQQVAEVEAVRRGRVFLLADDHASIPGPAFAGLVERLAHWLHPEVDWH